MPKARAKKAPPAPARRKKPSSVEAARAPGFLASRKHKPHDQPCCPKVSDMIVLELGNPIFEGALVRGLRRTLPDGTYSTSDYVEPHGYVIPKGKCLVVTDFAFYSRFTNPEPARHMTRLQLGIATTHPDGSWGQLPVFVTAPVFSENGSYGGNVPMHTGFAVRHGHYLVISFLDSELVSTYVYVYGYLADAV